MTSSKILSMAVLLLVLAAAAGRPGTVTVTYTLHRISRLASNQLAVWIEDADGRYVRTLFATDYMARRQGYRKRPQCCPEWVKASGLERLSPKEVDAVSGATQSPGRISLEWDCTDARGKPVAPGVYLYKIEGNIYFEKRVLWTGSIRVGTAASESAATAQYLPDASAAQEGTLVEEVGARCRP
jgi:hypothetical protein